MAVEQPLEVGVGPVRRFGQPYGSHLTSHPPVPASPLAPWATLARSRTSEHDRLAGSTRGSGGSCLLTTKEREREKTPREQKTTRGKEGAGIQAGSTAHANRVRCLAIRYRTPSSRVCVIGGGGTVVAKICHAPGPISHLPISPSPAGHLSSHGRATHRVPPSLPACQGCAAVWVVALLNPTPR